MTEKIIIAGAGGQGIMLLGKILAEAAMREGRCVTWLPSYGAEVRGGTANCMVVVSSCAIGSPYISEADSAIIMNEPSRVKFSSRISPGGLIVLNSSLIARGCPSQRRCAALAFSDTACALGTIKVANVVALGSFIALTGLIRPETVRGVIAAKSNAVAPSIVAMNLRALDEGLRIAHGICPTKR
jgi:2-oxoglutarate ferredoxin oxidoreductase subunit gamma